MTAAVVRSVYLETSPKCEPWHHRFLLGDLEHVS